MTDHPSQLIALTEIQSRLADDRFCLADYTSIENAQSPIHGLLDLQGKRGLYLASSRLSQKLDDQPELFDAIRTIACGLNPETDFLLTSSSTTCHRFTKRVGELFGILVVSIEPLPKRKPRDFQPSPNPSSEQVIFYRRLDEAKSIDDLIMTIADEVLILSMRKSGNVDHASSKRLASEALKPKTKYFINKQLTSAKNQLRLANRGAVGWCLVGNEAGDSKNGQRQVNSRPVASHLTNLKTISLSEFKDNEFLVHWTRRRVGPWPDQTEREFIDDLIFNSGNKQHDPTAALLRILATQQLIATNQLTRDPRTVVCFSDMRLNDLAQRRVFRNHLSRWDFEPFGIAIEKEWLEEQGARPVVYGSETTWKEMPLEDRPFFQLSSEDSDSIDWQTEREWRIEGDLNLKSIPIQAAVAFVPTQSEADSIASVCRWPVVVLND